MKKWNCMILTCLVLVLSTMKISAQTANNPASYPNEDVLKIYEDTPTSPEAAQLGNYGNIGATPYNGKVNVSIPIYTIPFDGINIPIELSYDTGGVRVAQEASWVGLNWNLSTTFGISRQIYGLDDFNFRLAGAYEDAPISGYIYNDIGLVLNEGEARPFHSLDEIINVHHSYAVPTQEGRGSRTLDTQPDVFTLNAFGQNYRFTLKKKGPTNTVETFVFNNQNVRITLDLSTMTFTLLDEMGFTFQFGTKEINTTFSTTQNGSAPSSTYITAFQNVFAEFPVHREQVSIIMGWSLDSVTSPNGKMLSFEYDRGLHFTFPQYNFNIDGGDGSGHSWSVEQRTSNSKVNHNVSTTVIENAYLSRIYGDFGEVLFNLGPRLDLSTGSTLNYLSGNYFGSNALYTSESVIRSCHGTTQSCGESTSLLPWKLDSIYVNNVETNQILQVTLGHSYFDEDKQNEQDKERYLRLKLDSVTINDRTYSFEYLNPNSLAAKDSDGIDFWGFDNGKESTNDGKVPSIGRFVTERLIQSNGVMALGHTFLKINGANRSSDFNFGKNGLLNSVQYPTGGRTMLEYEANDVILYPTPKFQVMEYLPSDGRYRWTNHRDESNFNITYEYLKCAEDPNYNYFEKENALEQGDATVSHQSMYEVFEVLFPSVLQMDATLDTQTNYDGMSYWGNFANIVLEEIYTGQEYPLFTYGQSTSNEAESPKNVNTSLSIPPGSYRVISRMATVPPGEDYADYPGVPAVQVVTYDIILNSYSNANADISALLERFEIGGARIKKIINEDITGAFANGKLFSYGYHGGFGGLESSGVLMDDLIFHNKISGFFSYSPRIGDTMFTDYNTVGGHASAQGSHVGYSFVSESQIDNVENKLGRIDRRYHNLKNEYFTESFDLPYTFDKIQGSGDPYINILGIKTKWFCSGLDFGNDCAGSTMWISQLGNVAVQNTIVLGIPLRLSYGYVNGNVTEEKIYDGDGNLIRTQLNEYTYLNGNLPPMYFSSFQSYPLNFMPTVENPLEVLSKIYMTSEGPWGTDNSTYYPYRFPLHHGLVSKISSTQTIENLESTNFISESISSYNLQTHHLTSNKYMDSKGIQNQSDFFYPYDAETAAISGMSNLVSENRLGEPIITESFLNGSPLYTKQIHFANNMETGNNTLPTVVMGGKGEIDPVSNPLVELFQYEKYSPLGKILQMRKSNGVPQTIIWGYNETFIVARIENGYLSEVEALPGFGENFSLGSGGLSAIQLDSLRNGLPNAMITTYSYKPGVGITSVTDPRGITTFYEYDNFNRLKTVKDSSGNFIEDYLYHFKN